MQFHFSDHVLDAGLRELTRGGENIAVEPQVFDLLIYLVENRDRPDRDRLGRPHRLRVDADQPHQRRAESRRR